MKEEIINKALERRRKQELNSETDNFPNQQPAIAPEPTVGMRIYMLSNYVDNNSDVLV